MAHKSVTICEPFRLCARSSRSTRIPAFGGSSSGRKVRLNVSLLELLSLNRPFSGLVSTDTDGFVDVVDEYLAVSDFPGLSRLDDGHRGALHHAVRQHHLDLDLRKKINRVFTPSIDLSMAFLAPESFHLGDRHSSYTKV